jgi:putative SOS response-associated peptidase YedK
MMSCTIIVTDANTLARPIHDRMPILLDKADIRSWLNGTGGTELLRPAAEDRLRMWRCRDASTRPAPGMMTRRLSNEVAAGMP